MAKRKVILNAALKALLAGAETSAWLKIPVTFISELAALPDDKQKKLAGASAEGLQELLQQSELATYNAALSAAGAEQIKVLISNLTKLNRDEMEALTTLSQEQYKKTLDELHVIRENTEKIQADQEKLDEILKQLKSVIPKDIKDAVENIFMEILKEQVSGLETAFRGG